MRPRREGLGECYIPPNGTPAAACFNEAEARRPRRGRAISPTSRSSSSFNEAEARRPRRGRSSDERRRGWYRFNEAEARRPRRATRSRRSRARRAGFNEAEARRPRRGRDHAGHRCGAVVASMRPRREGLGEGVQAAGGAQRDPASMRPRREGLGERAGCAGPRSGRQRFNEAEARRPRRAVRLPWQIRQSDASMRPRREGLGEAGARADRVDRHPASMRPRREGLGENVRLAAASVPIDASMRPRREGLGEDSQRVGRGLEQRASMRPRREGLGEGAEAAHRVRRRGRASMRPRREGLGERTAFSAWTTPRLCFNEAEARRPRRARDRRWVGLWLPQASMRPRREGLGEGRPIARCFATSLLTIFERLDAGVTTAPGRWELALNDVKQPHEMYNHLALRATPRLVDATRPFDACRRRKII